MSHTSEDQVSRVLVVDDMEAMRLALVKCLHMSGYEVIAVSSGGEALELLRTQRFDLLLTDQTMPGLSGLELLAELRARHLAMPFVLITAHDAPGLRQRAVESGAAAYLAKPFRGTALLKAVRAAIEPPQQP